jgi:hypothetical protein
MKTKQTATLLSLSISLMKKCLLVILIFSFLMQVSCRKDDTFETTGTATIDNTSSTLGTTTGATYYVSPVGNDAAIGDITHPWRTWQHAIHIAVAGDIVFIRGGVYYPTARFYIEHNGNKNYPICFFGYPPDVAAGNKPIMDCVNQPLSASWNNAIVMYSCRDIIIRGIDFRHIKQLASTTIVT